MSPFLKATLARAAEYAAAQLHREVTLEHVLLSLAEDPEASVVLKSSNVDIQRLMSDVSSFIGRNDDRVDTAAMAGAAISNDLRRILEASAAAASQGRRREINGAIVLAAIVGDGKSPSAHMLRSQGLTFEQAIRALQQAAAPQPQRPQPQGQPQAQPPAAIPRATTADDVLASARERALTHTSPPLPDAMAERTQPPAPTRQAPMPTAPQAPELTDPPSTRSDRGFEPTFGAPVPGTPVQNAPPFDSGVAAQRGETTAGRMRQDPTFAPLGSEATPHPVQHMPAPPLAPAPTNWAPPPAPPSPQPAAPTQQPGAGTNLPPQRMAYPPGMGGARLPGGSPAPLPPFPPMSQGAPQSYGQQANTPPQGARPPAPPQQAPWADPNGSGGPRGQHYDEAMARLEARRPQQQPPPGYSQAGAPAQPPQQQRRPVQATTVQAGQLAENIPRKMRVGIPMIVEARIARAEVKAIADGLQGDGAVYRHELTVTKAMQVRLKAPDGGFYIETASPETQWIENVSGLMSNDYASWRWSITARESGKRRLQLVISARSVGTDGLAAETALPDQIIDVKVGINFVRTFATWGSWIAAAIVGGVLSRFGDQLFDLAKMLIGRT